MGPVASHPINSQANEQRLSVIKFHLAELCLLVYIHKSPLSVSPDDHGIGFQLSVDTEMLIGDAIE